MSPATGQIVERETGHDVMARARARSALIPDLLVDAVRISNNVFSGWHGRRKRGTGENFWQFRPYVSGENLAAIDWRRSARDDHLYIRDREWQATHTIWIWVDESPSMLFKSSASQVSKQSRALVIAFAMAELLARSGERIGWINVSNPVVSRNAAERLAQNLAHSTPARGLPSLETGFEPGGYSDVILISDFLDEPEEVEKRITSIAGANVTGHLVQIIDPAEEVFPYSGRIDFLDPESDLKITSGSARTLKSDYEALFQSHSDFIRQLATRLGWSFTRHHTDRLASEPLVSLHTRLSGNPDGGHR